jgi:hypothetical protein
MKGRHSNPIAISVRRRKRLPLRAESAAPVNHKRVYRIMQGHNLLLARRYAQRPDRSHDGKVVTYIGIIRGVRQLDARKIKSTTRKNDSSDTGAHFQNYRYCRSDMSSGLSGGY